MKNEELDEHTGFIWSLEEASNMQHAFPMTYYTRDNGTTHIRFRTFIRNGEDFNSFSKISPNNRNKSTFLGYDEKFIIFKNCIKLLEKNHGLYSYEVNYECSEIYRGIGRKMLNIKKKNIIFNEIQVSFSGFSEWFSDYFSSQKEEWKTVVNNISVKRIKLTDYKDKEIGISLNSYAKANSVRIEQGYKPWIYIRSNSEPLQFLEYKKIINGIRQFLTLLTGNPSHIENINAFLKDYKKLVITEVRYTEEGYYGNTEVFGRKISYKDIEQDIGSMLHRWLDLFTGTDFIDQFHVLLFIVLYFDLQISTIVPQKTFTTLVEALEIYSKGKIKNGFYIDKKLFKEKVIEICNDYIEKIDLLKENSTLLKNVENSLKNANELKTSEKIFWVLKKISDEYGIKKGERLSIKPIIKITNLRNNIVHSPHYLKNKDFNLTAGLIWGISNLLRILILHEIGMRGDKIKLKFEGAFITIKNILEK